MGEPDRETLIRMARAHYEAQRPDLFRGSIRFATWEEACEMVDWLEGQIARMAAAVEAGGRDG